MKGYGLVFGLLFSLSTSVQASDFFIGIDLGKTTLKVDGDHLVAGKNTGKVTPLFKAGIIDEDYRLYGIIGEGFRVTKNGYYKSMQREETLAYLEMTANLDFFFPATEQVKLYAGPHLGLGYAGWEVDTQSNNDMEGLNLAPVYGGQLGVLYSPFESVSFEAGYRHSWTQINQEMESPTSAPRAVGVDKTRVKIDQVQRLYLSVNYTF